MTRGHEITITPTRLHVVVTVDGEKVAESARPVLLDETGLPTRYYLPRDDVRMELLRATSRQSTCPFKGQASYWSVEAGGAVHDDLVWSYEHPSPEPRNHRAHVLLQRTSDLTVDGGSSREPMACSSTTPSSGAATRDLGDVPLRGPRPAGTRASGPSSSRVSSGVSLDYHETDIEIAAQH
jgi:uncharacterized protein (DUF427 family)